MNLPLSAVPAEAHPAPLVSALLAVVPRLAALMSNIDLETHARLSAERDALARKDVVT